MDDAGTSTSKRLSDTPVNVIRRAGHLGGNNANKQDLFDSLIEEISGQSKTPAGTGVEDKTK
jgi:hypothetical protein